MPIYRRLVEHGNFIGSLYYTAAGDLDLNTADEAIHIMSNAIMSNAKSNCRIRI